MKTIYTILLVGLSLTVFGQSKKAFLEAAEKATLTDNHYSALSYYNEALEFDMDNAEVLYKSAEAARNWDALTVAEQKYSRLIDTLNAIEYPEARFYLAEVRQKLGKYDESKMDYELYLSENDGDDERLTAIANKQLKSLEWSIGMKGKEDLGFKIEHLAGDINSPYSDFGAIKVDEDLYYSSLRYEEDDSNDKPYKLISKILRGESAMNGEVLEGEINMNDQAVAHTAFNLDHTRLYYTLCEYVTDDELRCDIYFRELNPDGTMGGSVSIGTEINDSAHTTTQPNIATNPTTGEETLYFVSNRDGGKGMLDIWSAAISDDGTVGSPTNLSDINTAKNDITPFFHNTSATLHFSSRGYMTLGGYDIFSTQRSSTGYTTPINMGMPANSSYDDVYFTINDLEDEAYFSSNRLGSQYVDGQQEACCFDIYKANIEAVELILNGLTYDKLTNKDLYATTVRVIDLATGKEIGSVTNNDGNDHLIALRKNKEYLIIGTKDSYYPDTMNLSTIGITSSDTITKKLYLDSDFYAVDLNTFDTKTRKALNGATVTVIDITDPSRPNKIEVNMLSNDFHFLLDPNKKYKIIASRPDYVDETIYISTMKDDNPNGRIIKKDMYLLKPELDTYLPLALYFDNDEPDRNSRSISTDKIYGNLYNNYIARKTTFTNEYGSGVSEGERYSKDQEMDSFFEGEVVSGYSKLQTMMNVLIKELTLGQNVKISIRGYASPRFEPKYNLVLGQRRVASVKNEMFAYQSGILRPYLQSGQLEIIDVSFGEELAPSKVNDNLNNKKLSIYSPEASKERRVEIISVTKN